MLPSAHALRHKGHRTPNSLKAILIHCKTPDSSPQAPDGLIIFEDQLENTSRFMLESTVSDKVRMSETKGLTVTPKDDFSVADAWTGAPRFIKTFDVKAGSGTLSVSSTQTKSGAYVSEYDGRKFNCLLQGSIRDTLEALQKRLNSEQSVLDSSNQ